MSKNKTITATGTSKADSAPDDHNRNFLYSVAFIEGAAVMAIELAGAKMIAPFYGATLYVWASVLAVTLGGLTSGYFLGGWASYKFPLQKLLLFEILLGIISVSLMPIIAQSVMPATSAMGLRMGSLLSSFSFMILPLICMGMVSPTIIQFRNLNLKETGRTAGTVYAVSTIGGIIMTLLMGFYLLPEWGIIKSVFLTAGLLALAAIILVLSYKKLNLWLGLTLPLAGLFLLSAKKASEDPDNNVRFLYRNEGVLAQLSVGQDGPTGADDCLRMLFINNIPQTIVPCNNLSVSDWDYPHRMATLASIQPHGSKALLIGMGGGSIAMELKKMGFQTDIVELDRRVPEVAEEYFGFDPGGANIFIDDGRHFIQSAKKKYDLIIIDVLNGEAQPSYMFSEQAFAALKKIMTPDALLLINNQGYLHGPHGKGARSIFKTLIRAGFFVRYYFEGDKKNDGDLHFIASFREKDFHNIQEERMNPCCVQHAHTYKDLITEMPVDTTDAYVFTDDKPQLEILNSYVNEQWRTWTLDSDLKLLHENHYPIFR